ncbi:MAG TPA: hypothetical protein VFD04_25600 [Actinomycetes bacterium]|jgi:hypothetical protein|nr:hypothetical protein [Actinomycetes bacterium]
MGEGRIGHEQPHQRPGPAGRRRAAHRLARLVTEVLAPAPLAAALLLVVAWRSAPTLAGAVAWGLLAVLSGSVLPICSSYAGCAAAG